MGVVDYDLFSFSRQSKGDSLSSNQNLIHKYLLYLKSTSLADKMWRQEIEYANMTILNMRTTCRCATYWQRLLADVHDYLCQRTVQGTRNTYIKIVGCRRCSCKYIKKTLKQYQDLFPISIWTMALKYIFKYILWVCTWRTHLGIECKRFQSVLIIFPKSIS